MIFRFLFSWISIAFATLTGNKTTHQPGLLHTYFTDCCVMNTQSHGIIGLFFTSELNKYSTLRYVFTLLTYRGQFAQKTHFLYFSYKLYQFYFIGDFDTIHTSTFEFMSYLVKNWKTKTKIEKMREMFLSRVCRLGK